MQKNNEITQGIPAWETLFCILIVLGSGTGLTTRFSYIYYAIAIVFGLFIFLGKFHFNRYMAKPISGIVLMTIISMCLNVIYMGGSGLFSTFNNYFIILCSMLFAMNKDYRNRIRIETIIKVILFFSFLSTVLFIIYSLVGLPVWPVSEDSHIYTYFHLLNICDSDLLDSATRNGGIYWEPGMYQVFLIFVLIYYLFNDHLKYRKAIIAYLIIMILSTISVSGYVLTLIVFALYGISKQNGSTFIKIATRVVLVVVIVSVIPIVFSLLVSKQDTGSFEKRSLDLMLAWDIFLQHPILGHGIVQDIYDKAYFDLMGEKRPSSNGLMNLLMGTGILGATLFFYCYTRSLKFFSNVYTKKLIIPLLLWLLISINTEPIQYEPFISFLFGVGFAYCLHPTHVLIQQT